MKRIGAIALLYLWSCANQTTPTGGPKDEDPPVLLRSIPAHNQKNFSGSELELVFDEMIKLNNPAEEILIIPSPGKKTEFKIKNNRVFITPENTWNENTTYSISFREGIQDIHESNSVENLKLAFSTGPHIDSLRISGTVEDALSDKKPEAMTVAIYTKDTFNIFSHTPDYFTKTLPNGEFHIENLKPNSYYIYAFYDQNKNLIVESKTEAYGFKKDLIDLNKNRDSISIKTFGIDSRPLKINSVRNLGSLTRVKFNKNIISYSTQSYFKDIVHSFGDDQTEISYYLTSDPSPDSVHISLTAMDSIKSSIDTTFYLSKKDSKYKPDPLSFRFSPGILTTENSTFKVIGSYNKHITKINFDSLYIQFDTLGIDPVKPDELKLDSLHKKISLQKKVDPTQLSFKTTASLKLGKGAFISVEGDTSKVQTISIQEVSAETTGTLLVEIISLEKSFEVQLLDTKDEVVESVKNSKKLTFKNLPAGEYKLRVLVDENQNGVWDYGNIFTRLEPEPVHYYRTQEGNSVFPIRENWEVGPLIIRF